MEITSPFFEVRSREGQGQGIFWGWDEQQTLIAMVLLYYMPMIHTPLVITSLYLAKLHITKKNKLEKILESNMACSLEDPPFNSLIFPANQSSVCFMIPEGTAPWVLSLGFIRTHYLII